MKRWGSVIASIVIILVFLAANLALSAPPPTPTPLQPTPSHTLGVAQMTATTIIQNATATAAGTATAAAQASDETVYAELWLAGHGIEANEIELQAMMQTRNSDVWLVFTFEYADFLCVGITTTSRIHTGSAACDTEQNGFLWNYWFSDSELTIIYGYVDSERHPNSAAVAIEFSDENTSSMNLTNNAFILALSGIETPEQIIFIRTDGNLMATYLYPSQDVLILASPGALDANPLTATVIFQNMTATAKAVYPNMTATVEALSPIQQTVTAIIRDATQTATMQGTGIHPAQMTATAIIAGATATAAAR